MITLDMRATREGWTWVLRRGPQTLATGHAADGDEGVTAARVALDELYDSGLEAELCRPFWARSRLGGAMS